MPLPTKEQMEAITKVIKEVVNLEECNVLICINNDIHTIFLGNACMVCFQGIINEFIEDNNVQHKDHIDNESEDKIH